MKEQAGQIEQVFSVAACPRAEIAAYLDCELAPRDEILLERHLAACEICLAELNAQKKLLSALDFALEEEKTEIEIPENFAKVVAIRAGSSVNGLRDKGERSRAIFLCASLVFLVVVGLGAETEKVFAASGVIFEQTAAIAAFAGHIIFDIALGIVVILRSLANQTAFNAFLALAAFAGFLTILWLKRAIIFNRLTAAATAQMKK
jgi:predicted anti-sigma-YlaC factor YlaD